MSMRDFSRSLKGASRPALVVLILSFAAGCGGTARRPGEVPHQAVVIRMSGSDTMQILARRWAEAYMRRRPGVSVYVWGGGTARGVEDLVAGRVDICAASRPLQPKEVSRLAGRFGSVGISFAVAKEALSIYLNPANPVRSLEVRQLKLIFTGAIHNWREVGGEDLPIRVFRRSTTSGTYAYFREHVLEDEDYRPYAEVVGDTRGLVSKVAEDRTAIGFGGVAYGIPLHCRVEGIPPTVENIRTDRYPLIRYLYLITVSRPRGELQRFIDWIQSREGQQIVADTGFVGLW